MYTSSMSAPKRIQFLRTDSPCSWCPHWFRVRSGQHGHFVIQSTWSCQATFMPKPFSTFSGKAARTRQSLCRNSVHLEAQSADFEKPTLRTCIAFLLLFQVLTLQVLTRVLVLPLLLLVLVPITVRVSIVASMIPSCFLVRQPLTTQCVTTVIMEVAVSSGILVVVAAVRGRGSRCSGSDTGRGN